MKFTGGCLCGKVRYEADAEPLFQALCYCRDCQKSTGVSHFGGLGLPGDAVTMTGETKRYEAKGDSGEPNVRVFCPECGTTVCNESRGGQVVIISAGTLDEPDSFSPQLAIYTRSRPRWGKLEAKLAEFEGAPPMG